MSDYEATVYVANLPWRATEDDLAELFLEFGPVSGVRIIQDKQTGRSRGYGFVELSTPAHVAKAVSILDGREFQGRTLSVSHARPRPGCPASPRPPRT